jgi:DNA-binding beta-propeller fold protein YncE
VVNEAVALALTSDGSRLYVTGLTTKGGNNLSWATVAYDAGTGRGLGVMKTSPGEPTDVAVSPDGSEVFVTGWAGVQDPQDIRTMAYHV